MYKLVCTDVYKYQCIYKKMCLKIENSPWNNWNTLIFLSNTKEINGVCSMPEDKCQEKIYCQQELLEIKSLDYYCD